MNHLAPIIEMRSLVEKAKDSVLALSYDERLLLLEEAHVLSQPFAIPHFLLHWEMFKLAARHQQWQEVLGQIPRLLLAIPGSLLGKAPRGNVGSTKMGIFEEMSAEKSDE